MLFPPTPQDDASRLEALCPYDPHGPFDDADFAAILDIARDLFDVPTAFVSLVDRTEQIFAVAVGLDLGSTPRHVSFCGHAVAQGETLVVLDAAIDERFHDNPLVTGPPFIQFYAGSPLVTASGHCLGTFCVADVRPHAAFSTEKCQQLSLLTKMVFDRLEARRVLMAGQVSQARFENIAATSPDSIICADKDGRITFWNSAAERLFGHTAEQAAGEGLDLIVPPRLRSGHYGGLQRVANGAKPRLVGKTVELTAQRSDGSEFPIELSLSMWTEENGANFGAIVRDITDRRAKEDQLFQLAHYDALTGLPNRSALTNKIARLSGHTKTAALLLVDLDRFNTVNDDLGHAAADAVLVQISERLLRCVGVSDTVARLGGDEFAVLLPGIGDAEGAAQVAQALLHAVSLPITVADLTVRMGASIGMSLYLGDGAGSDELLSNAALALNDAKSNGRECQRLYSPALRQAMDSARAYDTELRRAYDRTEFELFYQPQIRLSDGALIGAEALLRWRHPRDGLLPPGAFLPGLENRPISAEIGQWILQEACLQATTWRKAGLPHFRMGVNLFGSQFRAGDLVARVRDALHAACLPPEALELEVTENIMLRHDQGIIAPLRTLREDGVQVAFDDYGTGYASLSMLKRFPLTRLKVDRSFVQGMCTSREDKAVVRAILDLGRAFALTVIAEGVETTEQADLLREQGCEEAQGYLFGPPMCVAAFTRQAVSNAGGSGSGERAPNPMPAQ